MEKAIFFDRDGILNKDVNHLSDVNKLEVFKDRLPGLKKLKKLGFKLIVISNQSVIARGLASEEDVKLINTTLNMALDNIIDAFYFCPHHPNADLEKYRKICDCRKPSH